MQSYQLHIHLNKNIEIEIGKLGKFTFPMGNYVYTGSAKKNIDERIKRHKSNSSDKKLYWHVDYLLNDKNAKINDKNLFALIASPRGRITPQMSNVTNQNLKV